MLFTIAWRNVWRNRKRSITIIVALAFGLWGGIVASGVLLGLTRDSLGDALDTRLSHIQVHRSGFNEDRSYRDSIADSDLLMARIASLPEVAAVTARTVCDGMGSSATTAVGVVIYGVDPDQERHVTTVCKKLQSGTYFDAGVRNPAVIGAELARTLELNTNARIVLTIQDTSGDIVAGSFRIVGIYQTVSTSFDRSSVFVRQSDLARLVGTAPRVHEAAIRLRDPGRVEQVALQIRAFTPNDTVETWKQLAPELDYINEYTGVYLNAFLYIIMLALLFGLTNTMLMSVLDRVREFGVLEAVGMKAHYVFEMIMLESAFLALSGALIGIIIGGGTVAFFARTGIDLSAFGEGLRSYGYADRFYPLLPLTLTVQVVVSTVATAVIASIYPAWHAIRLNPAQAIRTY